MSTVYVAGRPASPARTTLLAATAGLAPVGLAEVLRNAALDTRTDRKYVLPVDSFPLLLARLGPRLRVLEIGGRRAFGYLSVYFDTPDLLSYRRHVQGNRRRFKVRTRTYVDSADCVLEVKVRGPRATTVKHRAPHPAGEPYLLGADDYRFIDSHIPVAPRLDPAFTTAYHRLTLVDISGGVRITCDADLVLRGSYRSAEALRDRLLIETKTTGPAVALAHTFHALGLRPEPISKYCLAVALLAENAPANPWRGTLRRHFAGPA